MRFIYATRPQPKLEFATTNQREAIPAEADVYAFCDGALTIRLQDGQPGETMTAEEQLTLENLITQSQQAEAVGESPASKGDRILPIRLLRRLLSR
jgi:hypothetical protein